MLHKSNSAMQKTIESFGYIFYIVCTQSFLSQSCPSVRLSVRPSVPKFGILTDLYYVPDTASPIYFISDREDSQAEFSIGLPRNMAETSVNAFL